MTIVGSATTDSEGKFMIGVETPGDYDLVVERDDLNRVRMPIRVRSRGADQEFKQRVVIHMDGVKGWGCGDWVESSDRHSKHRAYKPLPRIK
jgi:hypothetical protein